MGQVTGPIPVPVFAENSALCTSDGLFDDFDDLDNFDDFDEILFINDFNAFGQMMTCWSEHAELQSCFIPILNANFLSKNIYVSSWMLKGFHKYLWE